VRCVKTAISYGSITSERREASGVVELKPVNLITATVRRRLSYAEDMEPVPRVANFYGATGEEPAQLLRERAPLPIYQARINIEEEKRIVLSEDKPHAPGLPPGRCRCFGCSCVRPILRVVSIDPFSRAVVTWKFISLSRPARARDGLKNYKLFVGREPEER
jgi:hypothetical protein